MLFLRHLILVPLGVSWSPKVSEGARRPKDLPKLGKGQKPTIFIKVNARDAEAGLLDSFHLNHVCY